MRRILLIFLGTAALCAGAENPRAFAEALTERAPSLSSPIDAESLLLDLNVLSAAARVTASACAGAKSDPEAYEQAIQLAGLSSAQTKDFLMFLEAAEQFPKHAAVCGAVTKLAFYQSMIPLPTVQVPADLFLP